MTSSIARYLAVLVCSLGAASAALRAPDKLVALTFDDSVASHYTVVRPILKEHGFGATFFITEGFSFLTNKVDYMTWEQIAELHRDGFEIGNHTKDHLGVSRQTLPRLAEQIEWINARCRSNGIPAPTSFAYPGNAIVPEAIPILRQLGIRLARRGGAPEHAYDWGRGFAFEPGKDHPLLIPSAGDCRPDWTLADFRRAVEQARDGRIAVLQFHGVPDRDHPWVHCPPERFAEFMNFLKRENYAVVALRDLEKYADLAQSPDDPTAIIEQRRRARVEQLVEGRIVDAATEAPLPARVYIQGEDGQWHFPKANWSNGSTVRYQRRSSFNTNAVEMHTTLSAHPFRVELPPGNYRIRVERGKEYFPEERKIAISNQPVQARFALRRWINLAELGWYSGDAHNHRDPAEIPNAALAEDVNISLPMVDWTTEAEVPPTESRRGFTGNFSEEVREIDRTHLWRARNTEYEIFRTGQRNHTLGAFLILNHRTRFDLPVRSLRAIAERAHAEGALIDLEKHNWPWSLAIIPLLKVDLYELANNHHWRVPYSVKNWATPAPAWMKLPGNGTDTEESWTLYTFQTYYTLLNCGLSIMPTAGTANGVHPVPLGFSRVYVRTGPEFSWKNWMDGLKAGRSFVTTGPMVFAQVDGKDPGATFEVGSSGRKTALRAGFASPYPLTKIEIIQKGKVLQTIHPANNPTAAGAYTNSVETDLAIERTSWIALRCFEQPEQGRIAFAHTAPWHFRRENERLEPSAEEIQWLIDSVAGEIERSKGVISPELLREYEQSLEFYRGLKRSAR